MMDKNKPLPAEFWHGFFEMVHHVVIIADDFFCQWFGFSRRPRGKWTNNTEPRKD